tara:strand:+ start:211 stop:699 length:489 start_codon:yes stop_codon:yes gene_type:complete
MPTSYLQRVARFALVVGFALSAAAAADTVSLTDGTKLQGEVVSMSGGVYTIRTAAMGDVRIDAGSVASIQRGGGSVQGITETASATMGAEAIQGLQSTMAQNPGMLGSIMQLQSDPQMQAILSDPELMRAVQSFDLETLRNHPKIRALMNNAKVKEIQKDMR